MICQWYTAEREAALVNQHGIVAKLPNIEKSADVDARLRLLGFRRVGEWEKTDWGWEVELRKK